MPPRVAVEVPRPAEADVVVERARVVLGQDDDVVDARVDAVADSVKSMIRYLPPNGTAGLARTDDRIESRSPSPPARITAIVALHGVAPARVAGHWIDGARTLAPTESVSAGPPMRLQEQARVHERAVELDRPVEVRAGRVAGAALVADDLALASTCWPARTRG